jgi:hypothetical protein
VKPLPIFRTCVTCGSEFLAEWARSRILTLWHLSHLCAACELRLRERAA